MSSSALLRRKVFEDAPLVIDNSFELELVPEPPSLMQVLQHEHPDAEPEEIEDAVQEAIDSLMSDRNAELAEDKLLEAEFPIPSAETQPIITPPPAIDTEALLAQARQEALAILDQARGEAARILDDADGRAAQIQRAAYDKGYDEGLSGGKEAGEEQAAAMLQQVMAIVNQATQLHDTMLHEAESEMVALCLEIARKIIQAELRTNPEVVTSVVAAAVQKINGSPRVTIKVNPGQVAAVRDHWSRAYGANYRDKEWIVEGDPDVVAGGCVLDTKYGSLDAQIGVQFAEIQKTFALLLGTAS